MESTIIIILADRFNSEEICGMDFIAGYTEDSVPYGTFLVY